MLAGGWDGWDWEGDVPETDLDLDSPFFKVFVLVHADLAGTSDLLEVVRKAVADFGDECIQLGLPLFADFFDILTRGFQLLRIVLECFLRSSDVLFPLCGYSYQEVCS